MMEGSQIPTGAAALLPSRFASLSVYTKPVSVLLGNTAGDPPRQSNTQELSIAAWLSMGASFLWPPALCSGDAVSSAA